MVSKNPYRLKEKGKVLFKKKNEMGKGLIFLFLRYIGSPRKNYPLGEGEG